MSYDEIYENVVLGFDDLKDLGSDYMLHYKDPAEYARGAEWMREVNEARVARDTVAYDGLLQEAVLSALAESDVDAKVDALLAVASTAIAFAASVERQSAPESDEEPSTEEK